MSAGEPRVPDDPAAREREQRRREREQRRHERAEQAAKGLSQRATSGQREASAEPPRRDARRGGAARPRRRADSAPDRLRAAFGAAVTRAREAASRFGASVDRGRDPDRRPRERTPSGQTGRSPGVRRGIVGGAAIAAIVVIIAVALALLGRDGEPAPVAPPPEVEVFDLTIPEGYTREQIAELAEEHGLRGNYLRATRSAPQGYNLRRYGADDAPHLEGFLFPATYELEEGAHVRDLVRRQLEAFEENLAAVEGGGVERRNIDVYDLIKIASMIEREVAVPGERRLASAVIHNRLQAGMALAIDATLRYEVGFDRPLRESELQSDSPYNTRVHTGLPPTPIGNPGRAAIEAATDPADRDYLYYVIEPGTCNEHFFTADEGEFLRAQAEYQAALEREGGSPTEC